MLKKNIDKNKRKERKNWVPYYPRITKNKTKYSRKEKHKSRDSPKEGL